MSLLIEGMKMPEYRDIYGNGVGNVHILMLSVNKDGSAFVYCNGANKEYCTVSEISASHGRLIDADRLLALIESECNENCKGCEGGCCAENRFDIILSAKKTLRPSSKRR